MKKTYAARGLLDWQTAINVGGAIIRILFSGGSMGMNGVIPAKYITDNPAIQTVIENSPQFKRGRIFIYSIEKTNTERDAKGKFVSNSK